MPEPPLVPEPVFVGSGSIGSCSDIDLDLSTSIGSGGRDWLEVSWSVNSSLPDTNITELRAYIEAWNAHHGVPELFVPNMIDRSELAKDDGDDAVGDDDAADDDPSVKLLEKGQYYEFSVKLVNFLGFAGTALPFRVAVAPGALPDVLLTSGAITNVLAPSQLSIFAQASVAVCPGMKVGSAALTYVWSCSRDGAVSMSVDPRYFKLDPFSLNATQSYSLQVGGVGNVCCCVVSGPAHDQCCMQLLSRARQTPIVGGR